MRTSNWFEIVFVLIGLSLSAAILAAPVSQPQIALTENANFSNNSQLKEHVAKKAAPTSKAFEQTKIIYSKSSINSESDLDVIAAIFAGIGLAGFIVSKKVKVAEL